MIIWRGFGLAVVGIMFAILVLSELGIEALFADQQYYQGHGWPKLFALAVSASLVWLLSGYLEGSPDRVVIDKSTGSEMTIRKRHDLFFVPLRYWPIILLASGVGMALFG